MVTQGRNLQGPVPFHRDGRLPMPEWGFKGIPGRGHAPSLQAQSQHVLPHCGTPSLCPSATDTLELFQQGKSHSQS